MDRGTGDTGELSQDQLDAPLTYDEDEDCRQIAEDIRRANISLEAALPGFFEN